MCAKSRPKVYQKQPENGYNENKYSYNTHRAWSGAERTRKAHETINDICKAEATETQGGGRAEELPEAEGGGYDHEARAPRTAS
jgi:hypothetical protein